jgi:hypothetical protein
MDCDRSIEMAIETVAHANDKHLIMQLIAYLMGEQDGTVKVYRCWLFALFLPLLLPLL